MISMQLEEGDEIAFLGLEVVHYIHELALKEGGLQGLLKVQDLESALGRPQNAHSYTGENDLVTLAAYYWHGVSSAHGYCDANKRTAFLAALTFLEMNGIEIDESVSAVEPGKFIEDLYKKDIFEVSELESYLRMRCRWIEA